MAAATSLEELERLYSQDSDPANAARRELGEFVVEQLFGPPDNDTYGGEGARLINPDLPPHMGNIALTEPRVERRELLAVA